MATKHSKTKPCFVPVAFFVLCDCSYIQDQFWTDFADSPKLGCFAIHISPLVPYGNTLLDLAHEKRGNAFFSNITFSAILTALTLRIMAKKTEWKNSNIPQRYSCSKIPQTVRIIASMARLKITLSQNRQRRRDITPFFSWAFLFLKISVFSYLQ